MESNIEDICVSFYERTYTFDQLVKLRELLMANDWRICHAVWVFQDSKYGLEYNNDTLFWVDFAEKIKDDKDFPEKHFAEVKTAGSTFVIIPNDKS